MKPRPRKAFAAVALVAGGLLVFFEARRAVALGRVESWFWPAIGLLVIVLAAIEFLPGRFPPGRMSDDDTDSKRADDRR